MLILITVGLQIRQSAGGVLFVFFKRKVSAPRTADKIVGNMEKKGIKVKRTLDIIGIWQMW